MEPDLPMRSGNRDMAGSYPAAFKLSLIHILDEVEGDDSWEKELDAKNRAKAGIDGPDAETLERNAERLKRLSLIHI